MAISPEIPEKPADRPCDDCGEPVAAIWLGQFGADRGWHQPHRCGRCYAAADRSRRAQREVEEARTRLQERIRAARLTPELRTKTFAGYTCPPGDEEAARAVYGFSQQWRDGQRPKRGLLLAGSNGVGKTHLALAALNAVMEGRAYSGLFVELGNFLAALRASFHRIGMDPADLRDLMSQVDLLVLDDVGEEVIPGDERGDWMRAEITRVLNRREGSGKPLILTTDVSEEDLTTRLGRRVVSRIYGVCQIVPVEGRDYRIHGGDGG